MRRTDDCLCHFLHGRLGKSSLLLTKLCLFQSTFITKYYLGLLVPDSNVTVNCVQELAANSLDTFPQ